MVQAIFEQAKEKAGIIGSWFEAQFCNSPSGRLYGSALYSGDSQSCKLKNDGNIHACKPEVI